MTAIKVGIKVGLKGDYKLRILRADRSVRYESDWIPNLITNLGMDRIGQQAGAVGNFCRIGTGTTTPAFTDTALVSQSAATNNVIAQSLTNAGSPNYETQATSTYEFALGAVVGNMAELGLGWSASSASTLFSRSRILDGGGSPTTITVLSSEILQVTYRLTAYPQLTDSTGTVDISGTTYNYTARWFSIATTLGISLHNSGQYMGNPSQATAYTGALGTTTSGGPSGTAASMSVGSMLSYVNGTFYRDYTITASISQGNLAGGIKSIAIIVNGSFSRNQIEFSPNIPKTSTNVLTLTLRQAWARH